MRRGKTGEGRMRRGETGEGRMRRERRGEPEEGREGTMRRDDGVGYLERGKGWMEKRIGSGENVENGIGRGEGEE